MDLFRYLGTLLWQRYFRRHLPWHERAWYGPLMALGAAWNAAFLRFRRLPGVSGGTQWAIARASLGREKAPSPRAGKGREELVYGRRLAASR